MQYQAKSCTSKHLGLKQGCQSCQKRRILQACHSPKCCDFLRPPPKTSYEKKNGGGSAEYSEELLEEMKEKLKGHFHM